MEKSASENKAQNGGWIPQTDEEREAVRAQLERILESPQFRISRRYPSLLRHVVEQALAGRTEGLKERTLGVEVFGREPDYDSNADPVVRIAAAQIRRRLAEYYQEPGREAEIRIEMPVGTYVPVFRRPAEAEPDTPVPEAANGGIAAAQVRHRAGKSPRIPKLLRRPLFWPALLAAVLLASIAVYLSVLRPGRETALDKFWAPVLAGRDRIIVCVARGLPPPVSGDPENPTTAFEVMRLNRIAWADAVTLSRLANFLGGKKVFAEVTRADETTLAQLRERPAVLIGGFNNAWIMRLTGQCRFSFVRDAERGLTIQDRSDPANRFGAVNTRAPLADFKEDFGIVMRYFEPATGQQTVIASGLAYYGTLASGEFLTDPKLMEMVAARAPKGWEKMNFQVVFSTKIINGETSAPHILATHFW